MKKILQEFKQFAMRGNVIDMAVGIIIGGAFGKIVSSVVGDIIMPAIGLLIGGVNFTDLKIILKQAVMDGDKVVSPAVSILLLRVEAANLLGVGDVDQLRLLLQPIYSCLPRYVIC